MRSRANSSKFFFFKKRTVKLSFSIYPCEFNLESLENLTEACLAPDDRATVLEGIADVVPETGEIVLPFGRPVFRVQWVRQLPDDHINALHKERIENGMTVCTVVLVLEGWLNYFCVVVLLGEKKRTAIN